MRLPKLRLSMMPNQNIGVFQDTKSGSTGPCELQISNLTLEGEYLLQQLIASPDLVNALEDLLEYVDPYREHDTQYNSAILNAKRVCIFARRAPKLNTVLWREEFFDDAHRALSLEQGAAAPQSRAILGESVSRESRTSTPLQKEESVWLQLARKLFWK